MTMDLGIRDRVALVTGAGQGIGRQIALTLAQEEARVAVNDIEKGPAEAVAAEIARAGGQAMAVTADVTDEDAVKAMVQRVVERWGRVDILVNNAGALPGATHRKLMPKGLTFFPETDRAFWDTTMHLVTYGTLHCTRAVIEGMMGQRWGRIVNIVSDAGRGGTAGLAPYSMAKAGVVGFSKALAQEVGGYCITVNCVSPGFTETGASRLYLELRGLTMEDMVPAYPMARGLGRLGQPSDIANAVAFLASERAEWITGQVLSVNGGFFMPD